MKKLLSILAILFISPILTACELSNTDLANSLEGNMTRLVYSVGYLDSISTEELSSLVNNSSYFTHSSLYNATSPSTLTDSDLTNNLNPTATTNLENTTTPALEGGLSSNNSILAISANPYRTRTYKSSIINNASLDNTDTSTSNVGVVDMSLLETSSADLNNILLEISSKRGIIMLYCTDLRSGRATLSTNDKKAVNEYNEIIQETTNYLNNTTGSLINQFNGISSISSTENSAALINAKLIRANEVLKTRYAKLDTCLDSLDAIINILVNNIGFEYASMYNTQSIENISLPNATTNDTTPNSTLSGTTLNSTISNDNITNSTQNITETTTPSCCPNCNQLNCNCNSNSSCCPVCKNAICTCEKELNSTNGTAGNNTIVNYNYEGQNTSNILPSNASTYPMPLPSLATQNNDTLATNELSNTEIVLNGGLVKNINNEKINPSNANNFISTSSTPSAGSLTKDHKIDPKLSYTYPFKTLEETSHNFPIIDDLHNEELIESETELTPEMLPFTGVEQTKAIEPQLMRDSKLGLITLLPFQYEEDNVLRKIPRQ